MEENNALVWIPHPRDVWTLAEVLSEKNDTELIVRTNPLSEDDNEKDKMTISIDKTQEVEEDHLNSDIEDISDLYTEDTIHEAPAFHYFKTSLFEKRLLYVKANKVLCYMNPYKDMEKMYSNAVSYITKGYTHSHIFTEVARLMRDLFHGKFGMTSIEKLNQTLLCCGDSGSGKTFNSQLAGNFIVATTDTLLQESSQELNIMRQEASIRAKELLDVDERAHHVFEAFGNAKTNSNDNSSRFGRYVKYQYTATNQLVSIYNETFFLEKSRLVELNDGERNYHIFYQLFRGMGSAYPALKERLHLHSVNDFKMLVAGNCVNLPDVQIDVQGFHTTKTSLESFNASDDELQQLWTLIAVMLHLGNAELYQSKENPEEPCDITINTMSVAAIAELLGISAQTFVDLLRTKKHSSTGKKKEINLDKTEVQVNIYGFLKHIYKGIYFWIVRKVNHAGAYHGSILSNPVKFIGILDIFGFEKNEYNSLEQLHINLANEYLKQSFDKEVFISDRAVYEAEDIEIELATTFTSNDATIKFMTQQPYGLMASLDTISVSTMGNSDEFLGKYNPIYMSKKGDIFNEASGESKNNDKDGEENIFIPLLKKKRFKIVHYADTVEYDASRLSQKNFESASVDYTGLLNTSSNTFLKATLGIGNMVHEGETGYIPWLDNPLIMPQAITALKTGSINQSSTVWGQFSGQLSTMMANVENTQVTYVKCIKPNYTQSAIDFEPRLVMDQLKYHGLMDILYAVKEGFPERISYTDFYSKYEIFKLSYDWVRPINCSSDQAKEYSLKLAESWLTDGEEMKIGKSMMFLRHGGLHYMTEQAQLYREERVTFIQKYFRRFSAMKAFALEISKYRRRKNASERAREMFDENGKVKKNSVHHHNVKYDVFTAINIMQTKSRRSTSPSFLGGVPPSPTSFSAVASLFNMEDGDGDLNEGDEHITRLHQYYMDQMDLITSFLRGVLIRRRHNAIISAVKNGDKFAVMNMLRKRPELIDVKDKNNDFATLYHTALMYGHSDIMRLLGITPITIMTKDAGDHSAVHYAALKADLTIYKIFYKTLSTVLRNEDYVAALAASKRSDDEDTSSTAAASDIGSPTSTPASSPLKDSVLSPTSSFVGTMLQFNKDVKTKEKKDMDSINKHIKRSGWLYKLNNSGRLARRWFILNKGVLKYYHRLPAEQDLEYSVDEFIITRQNCFFSRYNAKAREDAFMILNFISPSVRKKRKKIIIKVGSEKELQVWLANLAQIASFDRFRSYAPRFRNPVLYRQYLTQLTWAKETALHTMVHSAGGVLKKARCSFYRENPEGSYQGHKEMRPFIILMAWLVEHGCPVNVKNHEGYTALHLAVEYACAPVALALVQKGAQIEIKNFKAKTALDLCDMISAVDMGYEVEILEKIRDGVPLIEDNGSDGSSAADVKSRERGHPYANFLPSRAEELILFAAGKTSDASRSLKHALKGESYEYHRSQMPTSEVRLLPSPLLGGMGMRNPHQTQLSHLIAHQKKGFSYLYLHIMKHFVEGLELKGKEASADLKNFQSVASNAHLHLALELHNANTHQLVEPIQECEKPLIRDTDSGMIYWGFNYYVQTPLELIPDGCYLTFRLFLKDVNPQSFSKKSNKYEKSEKESKHSRYSTEDNDDNDDINADDKDVGSTSSEFSAMYAQDEPVEKVDIEISKASFIIDKSTIDSGFAKIILRENKEVNRGFGLGINAGKNDGESGAVESGNDKERHTLFSSLGAYKSGGSTKTALEIDLYLTEYFDPISVKSIMMQETDNVSNYNSGAYLNNPPHLYGADHDKSLNKGKRGVIKHTPEVYALSYFEGASSERYQITLPNHVAANELISNVGGFNHIDLMMPGHVNGGQSVVIVVPKYWIESNNGMIEVFVDDYVPNRADIVRLKYTLPKGVQEGPYQIQNTDGSKVLNFTISEEIIIQLNKIDGHAGLPILLVFNCTIKQTSNKPKAAKKLTNVFASFMADEDDDEDVTMPTTKEEDEGSNLDNIYNTNRGDSKFSNANPMK
jgi:hypothetical protein